MELKKIYDLKNTEMMKYLPFKTVLFAVILFFPAVLSAQNNTDGVLGSMQDSSSTKVVYADSSNSSVQTAYQKVKKEDLLGGVSFVNVPHIMKKNYFTYSLDGMQAYTGGFNGNIWGMSNYLVLVDGVPREASSVMPSAIKQITFLKGISAVALYGSQAANGVIYITTKEGGSHGLQISGRVNNGMFVPKEYPDYLGSAEYMTLYNEARQNDGLSKQYSTSTIYNYASGKDPYRYPNVNFYSSKYLQKAYNRYDGDVEISGGNQSASYYTNISFLSTGSLLDFGEAKNNRNNSFNIRGNVDLNVTNNISATVDAAVIYNNQQGVNTNYWSEAASLRPNRFAPLVPISKIADSNSNLQEMIKNSNHVIDGKYLLGGTQLYSTNPVAGTYAGGTNQSVGRQFQFNTGIDIDLKSVLDGLSFHSLVGVDYRSSFDEAYNNDYAVYEPSWVAYNGEDQVMSLTKYGKDSKTGIQNISNSQFQQTLAFSGRFNYRHTINDVNHISGVLVAGGFQQTESGVYHRTTNANLGIQLGYNYRHKYYADFSGAIPHSAKLAKGHRNAFSPTVSLGWRISKENFMSNISAIDNLKLTVSAGILNTDLSIPGYYLYERSYTQADGETFNWNDGSGRQGTDARRGQNLDLTFVKRKELNAGIDASLFNKLLTINGSFFWNRMSGGVVQADVLYPSYFNTSYPNSSFVPYVNYNIDQREGFDLDVNINKQIGGIDWSLGMSGTYLESKAVRRAEVNKYDYQNTQGKPLDALWGLQSEGLFMSQQEITNSPSQNFGTVQPGDIKYKDQNGDGVIDSQDQVYLGKAGWYGAPVTFGAHLTVRWKDLTLFALGTGQFGGHAIKGGDYYWVNGSDKYSAVVRNRWTPKTKNSATYPRLTTQSGSNNFRSSSFWMYSTDRFDLSRVQITYNLPEKIVQSMSIRKMQVYISGSNLLTISPNRKIMELNVGATPQTRFYNVGLKANF